ncbi:MAG: hypothetical protein H6Q20_1566 [Bacteroidetes bacterium]|nr:hypothetical protein [Bacteroidota bacterium]
MKIFKYCCSLIIIFVALVCASCKQNNPDIPDVVAPEPGEGVANENPNPVVANVLKKNNIVVWIEGNANFERLNSAEKMDAVMAKVKAMGATGIIAEIKGLTGMVQYNSQIATHLKEVNGKTQPESLDYLAEMIKAARKNNLYIYAAMSVMGEGADGRGLAYQNAEFMNMQAQIIQVNNSEGTDVTVKKMTEMPDATDVVFMNPAYSKVYDYEVSLLKEVVQNYDVDGIILDYCRYYDICADFSNYSLEQFKTWAGLAVAPAPSDIVKSWYRNTSAGNVATGVKEPGVYAKKWCEWRATNIKNFVEKVRTDLKAIKPNIVFGTYSGAWYDSYYTVGVNWASSNYDASLTYDWATPTYKKTGYAELLDQFYTGNYTSTINGPGWWTVNGQLSGTDIILKSSTGLLASRYYGSVDLGNTSWADKNNLTTSISTILNHTGGIMLFDLVHIDGAQYNQFGVQLYNDIKSTIDAYKNQ